MTELVNLTRFGCLKRLHTGYRFDQIKCERIATFQKVKLLKY